MKELEEEEEEGVLPIEKPEKIKYANWKSQMNKKEWHTLPLAH
jgi:hypothetical protein